jgi:glycosyl transferase family 4
VIPDRPGGIAYETSIAQAKALGDHGASISFFHLEDRRSPLRLWQARRRFKKVLRAQRPDVVHVHYGSVAGLWTVLSSPLPVVVTFTGDDLDRSDVPGVLRPWLGMLFSQLAAFFAAGIICVDERVRENLWWRTSEALAVPMGDDPRGGSGAVIAHLRTVAYHTGSHDTGAA